MKSLHPQAFRLQTVASVVVATLLVAPLAQAGQHFRSTSQPSSHFSLLIGLHNWDDAGDIEPFPGENFDTTGVNLELSFHGQLSSSRGSPFYWGITTGVMGNDSNIPGQFTYDDLQLSAVYLTPSMKWKLVDGTDQRVFLDVGAGYYGASIQENDNRCYWYCRSFEYYDDSAFGGFVGVSADFDFGRRGGALLNTAFKTHFADFDAPLELDVSRGFGGPIYQFQVGVAWGAGY